MNCLINVIKDTFKFDLMMIYFHKRLKKGKELLSRFTKETKQ